VSGEHFRVVLGTGANTKYKLFDTEKEARGSAADSIHRGTDSQVAVEENKNGQWVLSKTRKP
jgi:hypothetical protein